MSSKLSRIVVLGCLLGLSVGTACDQNTTPQSSAPTGKSGTGGVSSLQEFATKGVGINAPHGWQEPFARLVPLDMVAGVAKGKVKRKPEIMIADKGREYPPSAELVLLGPNYSRDGAMIQMWAFDFDPSDFPIGIIAFSPDKWIPKDAQLMEFPFDKGKAVAAPVPFGNLTAFKVRSSYETTLVSGNNEQRIKVIEDRFYCKEARVFLVARLRVKGELFNQYDFTAFKQFLGSLRISR
ncbi:MAG: hypothetical protein ABIF87_14735 [Pseudomonadota bacterium]